MAKILLVIEDYRELVRLETFLRKLGFDVLGVSNEYSLSEQFISFHPEIIVAAGHQGKVSPVSVAEKAAKARNFKGKVILCFSDSQKLKPSELAGLRMDAMIEAPVQEPRILEVLAKMTGASLEQLAQKLTRTIRPGSQDEAIAAGNNTGAEDDQIYVQSNNKQSAKEEGGPVTPRSLETPPKVKVPGQPVVEKSVRIAGYKDLFADEKLPPATTTNKAAVRQKWAEVGAKDDSDLNDEKKRFVRALFKKND